MTATLGSLKLTAAQKPSHITPIQQRRNKLAKRLWEQAELAKAKSAVGCTQNGRGRAALPQPRVSKRAEAYGWIAVLT